VNNRFETTIVDIVFSPTITESMLLYFSEFYEEHLNQFKHRLNQSLPIKPKQHSRSIHFHSVVQMAHRHTIPVLNTN
jgi:hypothetical protein